MAEEKKVGWWKRKNGGQKAFFIISIILLVLSIAGLIIVALSRYIFGNEVGDKLLGKGVENGFVLIGQNIVSRTGALLGTLITILICFLAVFIINGIVGIVTNGSKRSRTIGSLIKSLVKYGAIIVGIGVTLSLWGVDVGGIVAGIGILTLVIGLGCQSLIQDIISGLFIVFDDYFQVGDTVIIDGFRGTISEVGLKTTKIIDYSGNIKSITNSSITTVTNVTRLESMPILTIRIALEEDIDRVEAIIAKELPSIKASIPNITEGLWYKGVGGFDKDGIQLVFACKCKEDDRFQINRDLNRELLQMLKRNNIMIPYTQIAINPQKLEDRPESNEDEKAISKQVNNELRGIEAKPVRKKKSFKQKVKESFEESDPFKDE